MSGRIDLYSTYTHFNEHVLEAVRKETFIQDIGQNSWLTLEEYDRFIGWLELTPSSHVLEVACGSGGPALHLTRRAGCRVTGIDVNESGIATAMDHAARTGQAGRVQFKVVDATAPLPFADGCFDAIVCIDSINHLVDRPQTLRDWCRILRPGGRAVFTDPVVITGPVTNDELALRSSIGLFLFVPPGANDSLIADADFELLGKQDVTENASLVSGRWHAARMRHRDALLKIEGEARYSGLQAFFEAVHRLTSERRLSRIAYLLEKPPTAT